jgi:general stress protein 26
LTDAHDEARARLFAILRRFHVGTLVTRGEGMVHTQPLAIAEIDEGEEEIVFVAIADSESARDVTRHPQATVVFQDGRHCASWSGTAELVHDPSRILRLWREDMRIWFPIGPLDEGLVLLSVRGRSGEYWDVSRTRRTLTSLRRLGRASVREGDPPPEQHAFVRISQDDGPPSQPR